jgi:phage FluMu protein Com
MTVSGWAGGKSWPAISERGRNNHDMSASPKYSKKTMDPETPAPGWIIRCLKCDFTESWDKHDVRLKAAGRTYVFGRCPQCKRIRLRVIEKAAM